MTIDFLTVEAIARDTIALQRKQKQPPAPGGFVVVETLEYRSGIVRGFTSLTAYRDFLSASAACAEAQKALNTTRMAVSYAVHPVTAKLYAEIIQHGPDFPMPRYAAICRQIRARPDQYRLLGGIATPDELSTVSGVRAAELAKGTATPTAD